MNFRLTSFIIACCVASYATAADVLDKQAEEWIDNFKKADLDYSGGLSKAELDKTSTGAFRTIKKDFNAMDADKNGQITPKEYANFVQTKHDAWLTTFKKADLNGSGGLSKAELEKAKGFKRVKKNFDAMDSNHDGQVTAAERDSYNPATVQSSVTGSHAENWQAALKKADLNDSGGLSKTELQQTTSQSLADMKQNFDQADANKDGQVTETEYQAYLDNEGEDSDEEDVNLMSVIGKLFK